MMQQGSALGPLLCVTYINDLDNNIVSQVLKFADDTKYILKLTGLTMIMTCRKI